MPLGPVSCCAQNCCVRSAWASIGRWRVHVRAADALCCNPRASPAGAHVACCRMHLDVVAQRAQTHRAAACWPRAPSFRRRGHRRLLSDSRLTDSRSAAAKRGAGFAPRRAGLFVCGACPSRNGTRRSSAASGSPDRTPPGPLKAARGSRGTRQACTLHLVTLSHRPINSNSSSPSAATALLRERNSMYAMPFLRPLA